MSGDINTRATAALRALETAGVIASAWLPGMATVIMEDGEDPDSARYVGCAGPMRDVPIRWCQNIMETAVCPWLGDELLDLSDPVTAASLIVLVREAWGDPGIHCMRRGCGLWVVSYDQWTHQAFIGEDCPTEAEALVAALETKAREVAP